MPSPTLKDIALRTGKDISTVSRALSNDPRVKASTAETIRAAAHELGYIPNLQARALARGKTGVFWFICGGLTRPHEQEPAMHASAFLAAQGFDCYLVQHQGKKEIFERILQNLCAGSADGAFVIPEHTIPRGIAATLKAKNIPLIWIDRKPTRTGYPLVSTDNEASAAELARHAASCGMSRCVVNFPETNNASTARHRGFEKEAKALGLNVVFIEQGQQPEAGSYENTCFVASAQDRVFSMVRNARLKNCIGISYDNWVGGVQPFKRAFVVKQDFKAMSEQACQLMLNITSGKAPSRKKDILLPHLGIYEVK